MLSPDRPITSQEEDLLGREALAGQLASWIREAPRDEGFVIGVTGPWGSGKTSVLNLLEEQLDSSTTVVRFEPWLFSSADELVTRFFREVAAQLLTEKSRWARRIGKRVTEYGAVVGPAASIALGPAGQLLATLLRLFSLNKRSAAHKREKLRNELAEQSRRLVVLMDDIDRLDPREVREVMRLVKLVADLPNVVHVLSYDRARVQDALDTKGKDGRAYLEKIVQATMAVPPIQKDRLRTICFGWMNEAIGERELEAWNPVAWERLVDGGIEDYLHTLRDGRRLANIVPSILDLIGDEVASMDVIALEAVRIFDPDVHEKLPSIADALTGERNLSNFLLARDKWNESAEERIGAVLSHSGHPEVTRAVHARLFPAASHLLGGNPEASDDGSLEAKRVASPAVLRRYLHRSLSTGEAPSARVDAVVDALGDAELLSSLLIDCPDEELTDLLQRARNRAPEQAEPDVVGSSLVLLRAIPRMSGGLGFLDIEPDRLILHFVEDLLETLSDADRPEAACRIIKEAPSLSLRAQLLYRLRIPPEEASNEPRLDVFEASEFEHLRSQLADDIRRAGASALAEEAMPFWLVRIVSDVHGTAAARDVVRPPEVLRAVLERPGTALHPISSGRFSLHLKPLVDAAGEPVLGLLNELAKGGTLSSGLTDELRTALEHPPSDP